MVRIFYKSLITGFESHGERFMPEIEASKICEEMNRLFPEIHHWYE